MRNWVKRLEVLTIVVSMGLTLKAGWAAPSPKGETPEQFYRGKTLSIFTGSPGGASDIVTRALAPFIKKRQELPS